MLATNAAQLVKISVMGEVANPAMPGLPASPYLVGAEGEPLLLPMFGGLVYNVRMGDRALGWAAELVQPGVSIKHPEAGANMALRAYACLGNRVVVMTGAAAGALGTVVGKSGRFAEHVICHFPAEDVEKMAPGDKVQVQAYGLGLCLLDCPEVTVRNCSPELLAALDLRLGADGRLEVPVKGIVPSVLAGAGAGFGSESSVISIQVPSPEALHEAGLADLRFGDLVAIADWDSRFSHGYLRGSIVVGAVCQGGSYRRGYGPGLVVLLSSKTGAIRPQVHPEKANLTDLLALP